MITARHDPIVPRHRPDPELVARAQRHMMMMEDETRYPGHRHVRQKYEEAFAAIRVALDALREIYPIDRALLPDRVNKELVGALDWTLRAYEGLDSISEEMLGEIMHGVLIGEIDSHRRLDAEGVARYDEEEQPA